MIRGFFSQKKRPLRDSKLLIGACGHPFLVSEYGSNQTLQFDLLQDCDMTEYRFAVTFNSVNAVANPTKLAEIVNKAATEGINEFPILATGNTVISGVQNGIDYTQTESANYDNGLNRGTSFATAYPNTFRYLEIGNEIENTLSPFTGDGSLISHYNNAKYVRARSFIKGMIDGIKSVNSSIKCVIDAGDKHFGFIDQLLLDGCRINVIAWHWYSNMEEANPNYIAQELIRRYGNTPIELWFNEVNSRSQDDAVQAAWMSNFLAYLRPYAPRIRRLFVYEIFDEPSHADVTERNYGMFVYNGDQTATDKPLASIFKYASPIGYGGQNGGTTGGLGGTIVTVSTFEDFKLHAESTHMVNGVTVGKPMIIYVAAVLIERTTRTIVSIKSNKTILGHIGSEFKGISLSLSRGSNLIIRNIKAHFVGFDLDANLMYKSNNIWIDHCDFNSGSTKWWLEPHTEGSAEDFDGLIDLVEGTDWVTISWCKFSWHDKVSISGTAVANDPANNPLPPCHVTWHHNFFYNCRQRQPSMGNTRGHIYNNFWWQDPSGFGGVTTQITTDSLARFEYNYFKTCSTPIKTTSVNSLGETTIGRVSGWETNILESCLVTGVIHTTDFAPDYEYTFDPAANVPALVMANAGQTLIF